MPTPHTLTHDLKASCYSIVGAALLCFSFATRAQPAIDLTPVTVTGSRLDRIAVEGPEPETRISSEDIKRSGQPSVAGILRQQPINNFGSFIPTSGTGTAQGSAQINLRGLGAQRTLVLIDGRRLPNSPAFGGASQNLNAIPLEMIDRVEILRDGASAIYGSDAIAGVVNLITRKDPNGLQLSGQFNSPYGGGGNTYTAALSGGQSNQDGRLYFGLEYYDKAIIQNHDRDYTRRVTTAIGDPGTVYQYDAQGNVVPQFSNLDANGKPRNFRPFDNCPKGDYGSDAQYPYSSLVNGVCRYNLSGTNGLTAAVQRTSVNLGGQYQLDSRTSAFSYLLASRIRSVGISPPVGVNTIISGVNSPDSNGSIGIRMAPDNPNNPNPGSTLVINYRPAVLGVRSNIITDRVYQAFVGMRGRADAWIFNNWEVAASFNDYRQRAIGNNYGLAREMQAAVDDGTFNPFAPDPASTGSFRYTTNSHNHFSSQGIDGHVRSTINAGALTLHSAWGLEYRRDDFAVVSDAESSQLLTFAADGNISGFKPSNVLSSIGGSGDGTRAYKAAFMETTTGALDRTLELSLALRFDQYSDVGGTLSPKLSMAWRPLAHLMLRGSYGKGFRAPELASMYGAPTKSNVLLLDRLACRNNPGDASSCSSNTQPAIFDSNPQLRPETSRNISMGLLWQASKPLTFSLDYYAIKVDQAITQLSPQSVIENELNCIDAGRRCDPHSEGSVVRNNAGGLLFVYSPAINAAVLQTSGIDLSTTYTFASTDYGQYKISANLGRVLSYKRKDNDRAKLIERLDSLNASGDIFPRFRANTVLDWSQGRFSARLGLNYISKVSDCDAPDKLSGSTACQNSLGDYRTVDLQFSYNTPWQQSIALGTRNLFNAAPQVSQYVRSATLPGVFLALHDSDQRVIYLRLTQRF